MSGTCERSSAPRGTPFSAGICDGATADPECVPCVTDADCAAEFAPFCFEGSCVACADDLSCEDGEACTEDSCVGHACVHEPLRAGMECGGGFCGRDLTAGRCVECAGDLHCEAPTARCAASGACVECTSDRHCDDGAACTSDACDIDRGRCAHRTICADGALIGLDGGREPADGTTGCACRAGPARNPTSWAMPLLIAVVAGVRRLRRRSSRVRGAP